MGGAGESDGREPEPGAAPDVPASMPEPHLALVPNIAAEAGAPPPSASEHARAVGAWRAWLGALASDAEAALAAAMTYAALPDETRDAWLDALERDRGLVEAPRVALYAPLLAVEVDPARRARIAFHMGTLPPSVRGGKALCGRSAKGEAVCAVSTPVYLDFVELLVCRYDPERGVSSAYHEPFRHVSEVPLAVQSALGEAIELSPGVLRDVIEELAHAVLAGQREGRPSPEALARFSHLFNPDFEGDSSPA